MVRGLAWVARVAFFVYYYDAQKRLLLSDSNASQWPVTEVSTLQASMAYATKWLNAASWQVMEVLF